MNSPAVKSTPTHEALFGRVVSILEQAQGNVVRAVNTNMVLAYWLIGHEIVLELQGGDARAAYGKQVVESRSARLTERFGKGFSFTNLWYFRQFYLAIADRLRIPYPAGTELAAKSSPVFSLQLLWSHCGTLIGLLCLDRACIG